ncbi:MAG: DUF6398 domain-containing protein [Acidimicrobiales bacterium]
MGSPAANPPPDLPSLDFLVETWTELEQRETTALLRAVGVLGGRLEQRAAAGATSAGRAHRLPTWVDGLEQARVSRVVEVGHVLGDGEVLLLDVAIPGSIGITLDVYVDHNVGTFVKDAFVVSEPIDAVLQQMGPLLQEPGQTLTDLSPADAKAKLTDALASPLSNGFPFIDDDRTWPRSRPIVEWILRTMPGGGTGYVRHDWTPAEVDDLVRRFFASPWGRALRDRDRHRLLEHLLEAISDEDDPLRWSPVRVEMLAVENLLDVYETIDVASLAPDLLRAFIGFCHGERDVPESLTDETMAAVDRWAVRLHRATDELDQLFDDDIEPQWSWGAEVLAELVAATGSVEALRHLAVESLPSDEPFAWDSVPTVAAEALAPVVELVDDLCERFFDAELRTVARRFIARLAGADPSLFTRRSRLENTAAALVWAVATANDAFATHDVLVKDLTAELGISGTPSQRAETFLRALPRARRGFQVVGLGSTDLLTATGRAAVVARRDRSVRLLARDLQSGPEAWPPDPLEEVEVHDLDELWAIVKERCRMEDHG